MQLFTLFEMLIISFYKILGVILLRLTRGTKERGALRPVEIG